jgi:hypothetical protein
VFSEVEDGRNPIGIRCGSHGVLRNLTVVIAAGRIASVENEVALLRVGVAVVLAGLDAEEPVVFADGNILQRACGLGRVAAGAGAVGGDIELPVVGPEQVVAESDAGRVNGQRRAGRLGL